MEIRPQCLEKIGQMIARGIEIPNPLTLDVGSEVDIDRISADRVRIFPGCRIYGRDTVISSGSQIGREGPVTIENCQIGRDVELKGGYFSGSVFLDRSNLGLGAHVREGTILEEEAGGAHCVGLKQTILFPFVTLGSLVNLCDCLMSGGTSRKDHSEVGSSYIHFNFTPDGDKATASLIGDVPRGVMLNQRPIFLGGQGGMVGPVRLGFGNVVAAGTILRQDFPDDGKLIVGRAPAGLVRDHVPALYPNLVRIVENNVMYLANLAALREWYIHVRRTFLEKQEFGTLIHAGLLDKLSLAVKERLKRLEDLAGRAAGSRPPGSGRAAQQRQELNNGIATVRALFEGNAATDSSAEALRDGFLAGLEKAMREGNVTYVETVRGLPADVSAKGTGWLEKVVDGCCRASSAALPGLELFRKR